MGLRLTREHPSIVEVAFAWACVVAGAALGLTAVLSFWPTLHRLWIVEDSPLAAVIALAVLAVRVLLGVVIGAWGGRVIQRRRKAQAGSLKTK